MFWKGSGDMPFAITNRKAVNGFNFGDVPGDTIFYGTVKPAGNAAGFSPVGQAAGAQAEMELFRALKSRLVQGRRNVVFFVNGSGQDFAHVARAGAALEAEYGVEVVLLAWPCAESNFHKYKAHYGYARDAAPMFQGILVRWMDVAGSEIHGSAGRQILFFHGMGNQLGEIVAQDLNFERVMKRFQTVVVNAADVDAGQHIPWIFRLGSQACIVQNANDGVLGAAEGGLTSSLVLGDNPMKGKKRLGRTVDLPGRVPAAAYVDVTKQAGKQHEYFIAQQGMLQALYTKLLAEREHPSDLSAVAVRDSQSANLWRLK